MISIQGLHAFSEALAHLDPAATQRNALAEAAAQLEASVKQLLSRRPGEDHSAPWFRTGALHDSINHDADDNRAVIGSTDPVAVYQELGTRFDPPRPFLAAAIAVEADDIAHAVAGAVVSALKEALR
jgi:phage gpG-like protein